MNATDLFALHRKLVSIPSVSHQEDAVSDFVSTLLTKQGAVVQRIGNNIVSMVGTHGPILCLNSHLDTVPVASGWTMPPHEALSQDGKVFGLGSNDAKASVACMISAFLTYLSQPLSGVRLQLTLVVEEETGGKGTEAVLADLQKRELLPTAVVVGEPTSLDIAIAQKGLLVLELIESGQVCHAAHAKALGAKNALRLLAHDLMSLDGADLGPTDPELGPVTLEPTVASGGTARNMLPGTASCYLDVRTNPGWEGLAERLSARVEGTLRVHSSRIQPCRIDANHLLVRAGQQARPQAKLFGSRGVSDLAFFSGSFKVPGIKVGPGKTERSHTPDEYVLESELLEGATFYESLIAAWARMTGEST